jgi:hypothetical protein
MRALVVILVVIDALIALVGPVMLLTLAWVRLEGTPAALVTLAFIVCWVIAPWSALIVAWRQRRHGARHGRVVLILLIPIVTALIAQWLLEQLPMRGV